MTAAPTGLELDRVSVAIVDIEVEDALWRLTYEVHNGGAATVWLIDDGELTFERHANRIDLSYARERLRPGTSVFGYFVPHTKPLAPGTAERVTARLQWPLRLNDLWNADFEVDLPAGRYEATVAVGVAASPEPRTPRLGEAVEAPVLEWQKKIRSSAMTVLKR
jgi:hypothetical protein